MKHNRNFIDTENMKQKNYTLKSHAQLSTAWKQFLVAVFGVCSIVFLGSIVLFLYHSLTYQNKLLDIALGLYESNAELALNALIDATSMPTDLLTVIVSIFAIVVSVWVGLNIYNVISKDQLGELNDRILDTVDDVENLSDEYIQWNYSIFRTTFYNTYLEYTAYDYVAFHFNELLDVRDYKLIAALCQIETLYNTSMNMFYSENTSNGDGITAEAINMCGALLADEETGTNTILLGYIHVRMANLFYFQAHMKDKRCLSHCIEHAKNAIECWFPAISKAETSCDVSIDFNRYYQLKELHSLMDIYNLIGISSHFLLVSNMAINQWDEQIYAELTLYYDRLYYLISENHLETIYPSRYAMFMRNIGASKDFIFYQNHDTPISEDCLEYYQKALSANPREKKCYRNIISFRLKQLQYGYIEDTDCIILNEVIQYSEIYRTLAPTSSESHSYLATAYALKYLRTADTTDLNLFSKYYSLAILCMPYDEKGTHSTEVLDILRDDSHRFNRIIKAHLSTLISALQN